MCGFEIYDGGVGSNPMRDMAGLHTLLMQLFHVCSFNFNPLGCNLVINYYYSETCVLRLPHGPTKNALI